MACHRKTVRDTDIAPLRAVFQWTADNDGLKTNPAPEVKVRVLKKTQNRAKRFTLKEANDFLSAACDHEPKYS